MRDIHLYVFTRLKSLRDTFSDENFQQLATKSDGVFEGHVWHVTSYPPESE